MKTLPKRTKSQRSQIIEALNNGEVLTALEILHRFGCFSASQRIDEISKMGFVLKRGWRTSPTGARYRTYQFETPETASSPAIAA